MIFITLVFGKLYFTALYIMLVVIINIGFFYEINLQKTKIMS